MQAQWFNRPPRLRPRWAAERVDLPEPATASSLPHTDLLTLLVPLAGAGIFAWAAGMNGGNPLLTALPMGALAALGLGAALANQRGAARRAAAEAAERRAVFEDLLEAARARLGRLHDQERTARLYLWPAPAELLRISGAATTEAAPEPRLWERRPNDDDFLDLRVGSGNLSASSQAQVPPPATGGAVDRRLFRVAAEYATLRQVPISIPLATVGSLGLAGSRPTAAALARALLWQAAVLHAPTDLRIVCLCPPDQASAWEWLRWLPHTAPLSNDPAPGARMLAATPEATMHLASDLLDLLSRRRERSDQRNAGALPTPRLLVLIDGTALIHSLPALDEVLRHGPPLGMTSLVLAPAWAQIPENCGAMLELEPAGVRWTRAGDQWPRERFTPDQADLGASDALARRLAGVRMVESGGAQDIPRGVRLFDLLGIGSEADLCAPPAWTSPPSGAWRPDVPIGAVADGEPACLDLNEGRHGPHGIIAGATGAGKSVLLQSIIAALAATHGPERLQLLLIDFKGGAALQLFAPLPHTAGLVTDLEGRLAERAMTAIKSELRWRKTLLKRTATEHGVKVENITDYRVLAERSALEPLPNLLIVVDEFDELARGNPEFVTELVRVVKQGRSLGVHLLLATQQPSRAVSDEIRSQLSYFIALRLGSAEDSREMLLKPDAAFLPGDLPGRAYMRFGSEVRLLQVAQVTMPYRPGGSQGAAGPRVSFLRDGREQEVRPGTPEPVLSHETDLDVLVRALCIADKARQHCYGNWQPHPIWQPPLPAALNLATLLAAQSTAPAWMHQLIGLLDLPQEGRHEPFAVDLNAGHLLVVGAPGSGKTTLLRSLALGLAWNHPPDALWCYLVDAGGQGLGPLAGMPQVGAHIQAREPERVRRLLRMLDQAVRERQELLRAADAPDLPAYRARSGIKLPAMLIIFDKLAVLREELSDGSGEDALIDGLLRIARVGRPLGIHLVVSADRAADLSYRLLALFEQRVALRQAELHEYGDLLGVRVSAQISAGLPGRALVAHPDYGAVDLQVALPGLASTTMLAPESEVSTDLRAGVAAVSERWRDYPDMDAAGPPPVLLLPDLVPLAGLHAAADIPTEPGELLAPIGRENQGLGPAWLRLNAETAHALVLGPRRSGKTATLLSAVRALASRYGPQAFALYLLDGPRGGLRPLRDLPQTAYYAHDEAGAAALKQALLTARSSGGAATRLILIDDYQLCRERMRAQLSQSFGGEPNLIEHLCEIAQLGGQYGEHLILAASVAYADDALLRALDAARAGIVLWPGRFEPGTRLLGVSLPLADQRNAEQPPGRAILVREDEQQLLQIALS